MPVLTPDRFVTETNPVEGAAEPNQTQWISEAGELTQFGAFIEVLQPGCRSSIKHWHAATFKAGVALGHCLENRSSFPTRCLVVGTRAAVDRITYPDHGRVLLRDRSIPNDAWTDLAGQPADSPY